MKVNEEEAPICQRLIEKYGDDYEPLALYSEILRALGRCIGT